MQTNVVAVALKSWLAIKYSHIADEMQSLLQKYAAKKRWAGHQKGSSVSGGAGQIQPPNRPKEAGVGHAQDQKQGDERKQHPDDDVHLMDGEGK